VLQMHQAPIFRPFDVRLAVSDMLRSTLTTLSVFLGGASPCGTRFQYPGAIHRARWMGRAIYFIQMWLFRNQYEPLQPGKTVRKSRGLSFSDQICNHLKEVCLFVTAVYVRYWFQSQSPTAAPRNDLAMLCSLSAYPQKEVAKAAIAALGTGTSLVVSFCCWWDLLFSMMKFQLKRRD